MTKATKKKKKPSKKAVQNAEARLILQLMHEIDKHDAEKAAAPSSPSPTAAAPSTPSALNRQTSASRVSGTGT